jgi:hypothetical protein
VGGGSDRLLALDAAIGEKKQSMVAQGPLVGDPEQGLRLRAGVRWAGAQGRAHQEDPAPKMQLLPGLECGPSLFVGNLGPVVSQGPEPPCPGFVCGA